VKSKTALLRRLGRSSVDWEKALPDEVGFWESVLARASQDPESVWFPYREWIDPNAELQDEFKALIDVAPGTLVRLLDVGSGPLTRLGKKWKGRTLEVHPVDPLADSYNNLMSRLHISPPAPPESGHGEKLLQKFPPDHFDFAHASNSLDHSYDPLLAIRQMLAVVKPNCYVYLWHFAREGLTEEYSGLHQWDFTIEGPDVVVSDGRGKRYSLAAELNGLATLTCERTKYFAKVPDNKEDVEKDVVVAKLRKLKSPNPNRR